MDHACKDGLYLVQRVEGGNDQITSSALPTGFSEAVEHVGVLFWPKPGWPIADLKLERGRRDRDRLLQRLFRFCGPAKFAEGGGEPAVGQGMTPSAPCAAAKFGQSASAPLDADNSLMIAIYARNQKPLLALRQVHHQFARTQNRSGYRRLRLSQIS